MGAHVAFKSTVAALHRVRVFGSSIIRECANSRLHMHPACARLCRVCRCRVAPAVVSYARCANPPLKLPPSKELPQPPFPTRFAL